MLLAVVVTSVLLNVVRVFLVDWDLRVTRTPQGLRRNAGLLSKTSVASSLPRVQRLKVSQRMLERTLGLHTTRLQPVGEAEFVVPGCSVDQVSLLRSLALDGSQGVRVLDRRISPLEIFRQTRNAVVVVGPIGIGLAVAWNPWAILVLVFIPVTWLRARRIVAEYRWGLAHDSLARYRRLLGWSKEETLLRKTNGVIVRQSLFERKRNLATVRVDLAGGTALSIGMIPLRDAIAVRDRALYVAETDPRPFM